jgi:hypothetical protein
MDHVFEIIWVNPRLIIGAKESTSALAVDLWYSLLTCEILFPGTVRHGRPTSTQTPRLRHLDRHSEVMGLKVHYPLRFWMSCCGESLGLASAASRKQPPGLGSCLHWPQLSWSRLLQE